MQEQFEERQSQRPSQASESTQQRTVSLALPTSKPTVTMILLAIIVILFAAPLLATGRYSPDNALLQWGALIFDNVLHGEYYRLFTSIFLHLDILHIGFNAYALYYFGRAVEQTFGHVRFALIYFLGGLTGSVASFALSRGASVGASGAIFAIFGAEMVFLYKNRSLFGKRANSQLQSLVVVALLNLGIGVYSQLAPNGINGAVIDNWGHIGGFAAGILLAWFIAPTYEIKAEPSVDPLAPANLHVVDISSPSKTWVVCGLYAVGLLLTFVVLLNVLQSAAAYIMPLY